MFLLGVPLEVGEDMIAGHLLERDDENDIVDELEPNGKVRPGGIVLSSLYMAMGQIEGDERLRWDRSIVYSSPQRS